MSFPQEVMDALPPAHAAHLREYGWLSLPAKREGVREYILRDDSLDIWVIRNNGHTGRLCTHLYGGRWDSVVAKLILAANDEDTLWRQSNFHSSSLTSAGLKCKGNSLGRCVPVLNCDRCGAPLGLYGGSTRCGNCYDKWIKQFSEISLASLIVMVIAGTVAVQVESTASALIALVAGLVHVGSYIHSGITDPFTYGGD